MAYYADPVAERLNKMYAADKGIGAWLHEARNTSGEWINGAPGADSEADHGMRQLGLPHHALDSVRQVRAAAHHAGLSSEAGGHMTFALGHLDVGRPRDAERELDEAADAARRNGDTDLLGPIANLRQNLGGVNMNPVPLHPIGGRGALEPGGTT